MVRADRRTFDDYVEAAQRRGERAPFPRAYETSSFVMDADEVEALLIGAGFTSVGALIMGHETAWPDCEAAAVGILGTPFGPITLGWC